MTTPQEPHHESTWERIRPHDGTGWAYWIAALLAIVLILGGICLYAPVFLGAAEDAAFLLTTLV